MKKIKQVVGVDVSKDTLAVCFGIRLETHTNQFLKNAEFPNTAKGFEKLLGWLDELADKELGAIFVMEATGIYYENLAYYLNENKKVVCVLLPNKTKHFAKSLDIKSKTDKIDAKMLTQIGLEREAIIWQPFSEEMYALKQLCREFKDLKEKLTSLKNQLHAKEHSYNCPKQIIKRLKSQIKIIETQLIQVEFEIREMCNENEDLTEKIARIETIPGLGFMTIITIITETNAFLMIENSKQLVSYCGFDVVHNESGAYKGKSKVSKKGNRFIRKALYMPALCAIQHNPLLKSFYEKITEKKKVKKVGVTAVARKMLVLTYTLWKNDTEFDINYKKAA